jgi:hypothetical protein
MGTARLISSSSLALGHGMAAAMSAAGGGRLQPAGDGDGEMVANGGAVTLSLPHLAKRATAPRRTAAAATLRADSGAASGSVELVFNDFSEDLVGRRASKQPAVD